MSFASLAQRVEAAPVVNFHDVAYRHVSVGTDPLSGVGARINGGRWNPPDSYSTLYFGLSEETVLAEWARAAARQGLAPEDFLPRNLHTFNLEIGELLDLRTPEVREAVGLTEAMMEAEDQSACQEVGNAAHYLRREGLIAPSATGVGLVIALFNENLGPGSSIRLIETRVLSEPPPNN
jgi:RES domain-containing protein